MRQWLGLGMGAFAVAAALAVGAGAARAGEDKPEGATRERRVERRMGPHVMRFAVGGGGHLGVRLEDVKADDVARLRLEAEQGAVVRDVAPGSAAEKAGLKDGDVVLRYQGETVHSAAQLARLVRETPTGRKVGIEVSRDGREQRLEAVLEGGGRHSSMDAFDFEMPVPPTPPRFHRAPRAPVPPPPHAPDAPEPPAFDFDFDVDVDFDHLIPNAEKLREAFGGSPRPRLGIAYEPLTDQLAAHFKAAEGAVLVTRVEDDSPAARAGLRAGDLILRAGGQALGRSRSLREVVREAEVGSELSLGVQRGGQVLQLKVSLPKQEDEERGRSRSRVRT